jgi:hypothetical protein
VKRKVQVPVDEDLGALCGLRYRPIFVIVLYILFWNKPGLGAFGNLFEREIRGAPTKI